ncbi:hypothetical protein F5Y16DRAFT_418568 [Xylariaceae sp. FL0255]|nr:hypothetical protein F5Y16DRAFT_418568 [Xylariaceae sp. FL0255]
MVGRSFQYVTIAGNTYPVRNLYQTPGPQSTTVYPTPAQPGTADTVNETIHILREWASAYRPEPRGYDGSYSRRQHLPGRQELVDLVQGNCLAVQNPNDSEVQRLAAYVANLPQEHMDYHQMKEEFKLRQIVDTIDEVFFFALMRHAMSPKTEVSIYQGPLRIGRRGVKLGWYIPPKNKVELFVHEDKTFPMPPTVGGNICTLVHELSHAFLHVFSQDPSPEIRSDGHDDAWQALVSFIYSILRSWTRGWDRGLEMSVDSMVIYCKIPESHSQQLEDELTISTLRRWGRKYDVSSVDYRGTSKRGHLPSRRQLVELVERHCLAISDPYHMTNLEYENYVSELPQEALRPEKIIEQIRTGKFMEWFDSVYFFGLLTSTGESERLVNLKLSWNQRRSQLMDTLGKFESDKNNIELWVYNDRETIGRFLGTLLHEMGHAFLFIFSNDPRKPSTPASPQNPMGPSIAEALDSHTREWQKLVLFLQNCLAYVLPEDPGLASELVTTQEWAGRIERVEAASRQIHRSSHRSRHHHY